MSSSDSEVTSKRKRESSSSESSPDRRIRLPSPTTDPSLTSATMALPTSSTMASFTSSTVASHSSATITPLTSSTMALLTSSTMASTQTVTGPSVTLPETVPETAKLQQQDTDMVPEAEAENVQKQDNDAVQEAEQENVQQQDDNIDPEDKPENDQQQEDDDMVESVRENFQQQDDNIDPEAKPENDQQRDDDGMVESVQENVQQQDDNIDPEAEQGNGQQQDGLYADNFGGKAVEELPQPAPGPALRREILVRSQLVYEEFSQHVVDGTHVGAIFADECDSWLELSQRVRLIYDRVADREAAAEDLTTWPGRVVRFFSRGVNGQVVQRNCPRDDWVGLDLANNLFLVKLELSSRGRKCRIEEGFAYGTDELRAQIVIHNFPTWLHLIVAVREVYYELFLGEVAPALEEGISPLNCCPGAHVTFWGDLREQWFWGTKHRGNGWQLNWPAACQGICKVRIYRNNL